VTLLLVHGFTCTTLFVLKLMALYVPDLFSTNDLTNLK
jgi:hypothetical protein